MPPEQYRIGYAPVGRGYPGGGGPEPAYLDGLGYVNVPPPPNQDYGSQEALRARRRAARGVPSPVEMMAAGAPLAPPTAMKAGNHVPRVQPAPPPNDYGSQEALKARRRAARGVPNPMEMLAAGTPALQQPRLPEPHNLPPSPPRYHPSDAYEYAPAPQYHGVAAPMQGPDPLYGSQAALKARRAAARSPSPPPGSDGAAGRPSGPLTQPSLW